MQPLCENRVTTIPIALLVTPMRAVACARPRYRRCTHPEPTPPLLVPGGEGPDRSGDHYLPSDREDPRDTEEIQPLLDSVYVRCNRDCVPVL
ncbi:hypothetical protein QFZ58_000240 [Streptomyces sp. B1I3]|nr:hypothetical protein [Streptomyces sp. B1I3]